MAYADFAKRVTASGIISDPWVDGAPRFSEEPLIVPGSTAEKLARAGAQVGQLFDAAFRLVFEEPLLMKEFFGMSPVQCAMAELSYPFWHGIARADIFITSSGLQIAELNCDTPTGEPEAVVLSALAAESFPKLQNPNAGLEAAFINLIRAVRDRLVVGKGPSVLGVIYPTEFPEDLSLIKLYRKWCEAAGFSIALGSPYNLSESDEGRVQVFDASVSMLLRHYKTDWWSERVSAWTDEEVADAEPLTLPLQTVLRAGMRGKTATLNPFGSVLTQNKRMMAFMWEHIHRFPIEWQTVIEKLIPWTQRLEAAHPELLRATREDWVLKSDYGAEGEEVIVGKHCDHETWTESLALARKGRWIAQRYFEADRDAEGRIANYGVYLVAGEPRGLYVRKSVGPTDGSSESIGALIDPNR